jgi:hypothetical protein
MIVGAAHLPSTGTLPRHAAVPDVDLARKRWLRNAVNNLVYYRGDSFTLVGLKAACAPQRRARVLLKESS